MADNGLEALKLAINAPIKALYDSDTKSFVKTTTYRYMFPYIPYNTGVLASTTDMSNSEGTKLSQATSLQIGINALFSDPDFAIKFNALYAEEAYNGYGWNFHKDIHPLAQAQWDLPCRVGSEHEKICQEIEKYIERKLNNNA